MDNNKEPGDSRKRKLDQECPETSGNSDASTKKLKVDTREIEENHFYVLYQEVLDDIKNKNEIPDEDIVESIRAINASFNFEAGNRFSDVNLGQLSNICGYLSRYGTHSAGLTRARIMDAVRNCPQLKSALQKKNKEDGELRVVSIGGGPGNDALGFCSALSELEIVNWRSLSVTVVDKAEKWRDCVTLVDKFLREKDFGSVSKLFQEKEVKMSFIPANMTADLCESDPCYKDLQEADVVLECKMINGLYRSQKGRVSELLRKTLRDDALLLLIHSPFNDDNWRDFDILYTSPEDQPYRLSTVHSNFGFDDGTKSKAQIRVLRKKQKK